MKKRSLLAAVAMLLVAILAATGTTYAWFTEANAEPKATIQMGVAKGSSLQISLKPSSDYKSVLGATDFTNAGITFESWKDFSTNTADFAKDAPVFYSETYDAEGLVNGYVTDDTVQKVTIYFRSTESEGVVLTSNAGIAFPSGTSTNLAAATRVAVDSNGANTTALHTILAQADADATVSGTVNSTTTAEGSYEAKAISKLAADETVVVNLNQTASADGYYYGSATFYLFVEGTKAENGDLAGATNITATLAFTQPALNAEP